MTTGVMSPLKRVDCFTIKENANSENIGERGKKGNRNRDTLPTLPDYFLGFKRASLANDLLCLLGVLKIGLAWINLKEDNHHGENTHRKNNRRADSAVGDITS
jgi:hypothetical protein